MIYLVATILLNVFIFAVFKVFSKYEIDRLQAIVFNYLTCVVTGCFFLGDIPFTKLNLSQPWFSWSLMTGVSFIFIFNFIAYSINKSGLTVSTVANKISLVIPVLFAWLLYDEKMGWVKLLGIALAFPAVYFTTKTDNKEETKNILLPILLFIASGLLDTLVKYVEQRFLPEQNIQGVYLVHVFATAALIGLAIMLVLRVMNKTRLKWKNLLAGVIIGVPNYFSMYFFVRLLNHGFLQSSAAIPVNNIGIVLLSTLTAIVFFKERMTTMRVIGLALSIMSILLILYTDIHG